MKSFVKGINVELSSAQSFSHVQLFVTTRTTKHQASLCTTNTRSLLKLMSIELVMTTNHFTLCRPLLLLPSIFPSIRVFSNRSLCIRWPNIEVSASTSVLPMNIQDWFPLGWNDFDLLAVQGTLKSLLNITVQEHQFFRAQLSLEFNSHIHTWLLEKPVLTRWIFASKLMSVLFFLSCPVWS